FHESSPFHSKKSKHYNRRPNGFSGILAFPTVSDVQKRFTSLEKVKPGFSEWCYDYSSRNRALDKQRARALRLRGRIDGSARVSRTFRYLSYRASGFRTPEASGARKISRQRPERIQ